MMRERTTSAIPTTIRTTPTTGKLTPLTDAVPANFKIAPTAINTKLEPILISRTPSFQLRANFAVMQVRVPVPPQANLPFRHLRAGGGVPGEISCGAGLMASSLANLSKVGHARWKGPQLIILGVVLVVVGLVAGIPILETIGFLLVVVGVSLAILGAMGRAVGGRKHYY